MPQTTYKTVGIVLETTSHRKPDPLYSIQNASVCLACPKTKCRGYCELVGKGAKNESNKSPSGSKRNG